jgi:hypothetical protein
LLVLTGLHFDTLKPPFTLSFGLPDGSDVTAASVMRLNDTHATAELPVFRGLTYYARADVSSKGE